MPTSPDPRSIPAADNARSICEGCGADLIWATTVAGPNGRGGKGLPLDPLEDLAGSYAVTPTHAGYGRLLARALAKGEQPDRPLEYAGMPHFATCPTRTRPTPPPPPPIPARRRNRPGATR